MIRKSLAVSEPWSNAEHMIAANPTMTYKTDYLWDSCVAELSTRAEEVKAHLAENELLYDSQKITQQVYEGVYAEGRIKLTKIIDDYEKHCRLVGVANPGLLPSKEEVFSP